MSTSVLEKWQELQREQPGIRIRNAAELIGVSEWELLLLETGTTPLENNVHELLAWLTTAGKVMALTRNNWVVQEQTGIFPAMKVVHGNIGLLIDPNIEARLFLDAFALVAASDDGKRKSLQFYDAYGDAILKIFFEEISEEKWNELLQHKTATAHAVKTFTAQPSKPLDTVDVAGFQKSWENLPDPHAFPGVLRQFQLTRRQAIDIAPEGYAKKIEASTVHAIMQETINQQIPLLLFTGNRGNVQIFDGNIHSWVAARGWHNVLDPNLQVHVNIDAMESFWLVKKPSADGFVHSIELFGDGPEPAWQVFGHRKPGVPELESWRNLILSHWN